MIVVYGTRLYGKVRRCGSSFLATRFVHIWYVPLIPIGTQLVLEELDDGYRGIPAPFSFRSMFAAYLRVWGPIALIAALVMGSNLIDELDEPAAMLIVGAFTAVVAFALLAGTVLAWALLGKLSTEERRQRSAYAMHLGYFVDPAELGDARHDFRARLMETIRARAHGLASMGYRMNADPTVAWPHIALDPTHNDDELVTAALTLSRIEASLAPEPHKQQMLQLHDQLWRRLATGDRPYLNAHATA